MWGEDPNEHAAWSDCSLPLGVSVSAHRRIEGLSWKAVLWNFIIVKESYTKWHSARFFAVFRNSFLNFSELLGYLKSGIVKIMTATSQGHWKKVRLERSL